MPYSEGIPYTGTGAPIKSVNIPDDVYQRAAELAERDQVSVGKLLAVLILQHAREWTRLRARAERGSLEKLRSVLQNVSDAPPEPFDQL